MTDLIWEGRDLLIVMDHPKIKENDKRDFEDHYFYSNVINYVPMGTKLLDILVAAKLFKSKNEARSNWKRRFELEPFWNKFEGLGKLKRNLYILNLTEEFVCLDEMEEPE